MIKSVLVRNYILIDSLTLDFDKGFNVFTGETGAGKSIIIGAIDVALGAKYNKDVIKNGAEKAYIELTVKLDDEFDKTVFIENGIDVDGDEIIVSREILPSTSRSRVNGMLVSLDFVKEIREKLLDIHTQHQSYNYLQPKNHIVLLDNFALKPHRENVKEYGEKYQKLLCLRKKLKEVQDILNTNSQQIEFLKFEIDEIERAQIEDTDECEKLEKELEVLSNIEKLKELSYSSYQALYGEDENIISALGNVKTNLSKLSRMDESALSMEEDLINAYEILREISSQLRTYAESKENDNERIDIIQERLSLLDKIKRKYGSTLSAVLETYGNFCEELSKIEISGDEVKKIEKEIEELNQELDILSKKISAARKELAKVLSEAVTKELEKLELPKSRFEIFIENVPMNESGIDKVEFMISTNISESVKPLAKTASGGEISRVMLAIKTIFAKADKTNTVIFDEIDTGISGKASQSVADAISALSDTHQIILITHQPIIAAKANAHFYVKKEQTDKTLVNVYKLDDDNRVKAIALLAAGEINEESSLFAKTLLSQR